MHCLAIAVLVTGLLAGCHGSPSLTPDSGRGTGRFSGIGMFDAGKLWGQMTDGRDHADPASAKLTDDEHLIVVIDNRTGEVRQCGDHSGYCVATNPWTPGAAVPGLPVKLQKHAEDFAQGALSPTGSNISDMENSSDADTAR